MGDSLAALVLAAGAGTRLRPLTLELPKALCPVGDRPLVDHAIEGAHSVTPAVAVNVHYGRARMEEHLSGRVHLSIEEQPGLGTAGAIVELLPWLERRDVLVVNADTFADIGLAHAADQWDGERVAVMVVGDADLGPTSRVAGSLVPADVAATLPAGPSGLYETCWRPAQEDGRLQVVSVDGSFHDCGTPTQYLAANLAWSGGRSVVAPGALVEGQVVRSVLWPGALVAAGEVLVDAIRTGAGRTVLVR